MAGVYVAVLAGYWLSKVALRRRARRSAPDDTLALLPSALVPWDYLGCARTGTLVRLFRINALSGVLIEEGSCSILDAEWLERVADIPEVQVMRELSPAYHVVETEKLEDGTAITFRDLRTRNFKTSFGELRLVLRADGTVRDKVFHV
ncbi:MAG: hypothetical protein O7H41_00830 [Planctomycetota bacterium]|nr:hypothetical protein [Planctomycetota bacterium]